MSDDTAKEIDSEIRLLINKSYEKATKMITENIDKLHIMSDTLMQYETIDRDQIDDIMMGVKPRPPKDWDDNDENNKTPSGGDGKVKEAGFTDPANSH